MSGTSMYAAIIAAFTGHANLSPADDLVVLADFNGGARNGELFIQEPETPLDIQNKAFDLESEARELRKKAALIEVAEALPELEQILSDYYGTFDDRPEWPKADVIGDIQRDLQDANLYWDDVDDAFGPNMASAVISAIEAMRERGIEHTIGYNTIRALREHSPEYFASSLENELFENSLALTDAQTALNDIKTAITKSFGECFNVEFDITNQDALRMAADLLDNYDGSLEEVIPNVCMPLFNALPDDESKQALLDIVEERIAEPLAAIRETIQREDMLREMMRELQENPHGFFERYQGLLPSEDESAPPEMEDQPETNTLPSGQREAAVRTASPTARPA